LSFKDFEIRKIIAFPVFASVLLIVYLVISVSRLVLPRIGDSLFFLILAVFSTLFFAGMCYFIYITDKYTKSFRIFISAICCLFVNTLIPVNELFYYNKMFTMFINIVEMMGMFFLTTFLIDSKPKKTIKQDYFL